ETISGTRTLRAVADDDFQGGRVPVQFSVDGRPIGPRLTTQPDDLVWDSTTVSDGPHTLAATATASDGWSTTAKLTMVVDNAGLVAAYGFNGNADDASGHGLDGAIRGARTTAAGRFRSALTFDGLNDWVTVGDANPLDLTIGMTVEAWV